MRSCTKKINIFAYTILVFAMVFSVSFAFFSPLFASAETGVPTPISYQGHLTDSGGNPLGGAGTPYFFKFSLWDSPTVGSGTKVWPTSNPNSTSLSVKQGVFNVNIGDTENGYPDTLDYNWNSNKKVYLQVEISSDNSNFETLSPRSPINSTPFSQVASQVSGVGQSSFGTTTPFLNTLISAISTSINSAVLSIKGIAGQVANLFNIFDSNGNTLFAVSPSGNVGIGTTTPTSGKLTILGGTSGNFDSLALRHAGTASNSNVALSFYPAGGWSGMTLPTKIVATAPGGNVAGFDFITNNSGLANTAMSILGNGNVGIGTTAPTQLLHISSTASTSQLLLENPTVTNGVGQVSPQLRFSSSMWNVALGPRTVSAYLQLLPISGVNTNPANGKLSFFLGENSSGISEKMTITSDGNIGIGITSPQARLQIDSGNSGLTTVLNSAAAGGSYLVFKESNVARGYVGGSPQILTGGLSGLGLRSSGAMQFGTNGDNIRMTIDTSGNVGIGTSTPSTSLHIVGSAAATGLLQLQGTQARTVFKNTAGTVKGGFGIGSDEERLFLGNSTTEVISILQSGNVGIGTTTPSQKLDVAGGGTFSGQITSTQTGGGRYVALGTYGGFPAILSDGASAIRVMERLEIFGRTGARYFSVKDDAAVDNVKIYGQGNSFFAATNGKVGFGSSTTPLAMVHIISTAEQLRLNYDGSNYWTNTINSTGGLTMQGVGTGGALTLSPTAGQNVNLSLSGTGDFAVNTNQLYVDTSTGNLGIGMITPGQKLTVAGNASIDSGLYTTTSLTLGSSLSSGQSSAANLIPDFITSPGKYDSSAGGNTINKWVFYNNPGAATYGIGMSATNGFGLFAGDKGFAFSTGATQIDGTGASAKMVILNGGNVGIGTTTPTSKLTLGSGQFELPIGTLSSPSLTFSGDLDTGIYSTMADRFAVSVGGVQTILSSPTFVQIQKQLTGNAGIISNLTSTVTPALQVVQSGAGYGATIMGGNVGIGTSTPLEALHIIGNLKTSGTATVGSNLLVGGSIIYLNTQQALTQGTNSLTLGAASYFTTLNYGNPSTLNHNFIAGNVGIGTSTPTNKLDVWGNLSVGTSSTPLLFVNTATESVGIRTNNPLVPLHILPVVSGGAALRLGQDGATGRLEFGNINVAISRSSNMLAFQGFSGFTFGIPNGEVVRITNIGNVGIGTTTPSAQLHTTGTVRFSTFTAGSLQTDANGNLTVSSDEKLKDIQGNFTRGLADLQKINPISYRWNVASGYDTKNIYSGFSAQNIQLAIPEAVSTSSNGYLALSDRPIIATLVNAVKEMYSKVMSLFDGTGTAKVKELNTEKLCIEDVCVTKTQLQQILQNGSVAPAPAQDATPTEDAGLGSLGVPEDDNTGGEAEGTPVIPVETGIQSGGSSENVNPDSRIHENDNAGEGAVSGVTENDNAVVSENDINTVDDNTGGEAVVTETPPAPPAPEVDVVIAPVLEVVPAQ